METDGRSARQELWRRYDAGTITTEELDARLVLLDRAGDDPLAIGRALDGPTPRRSRRSTRRIVLAGSAALAVLAAAGGVWWAMDSGASGGSDRPVDGNGFETTIVVGFPAPAPEPADCPEADEALAEFDARDTDEPAANPALLSSPPALPEGYTVADEESIAVGTDPNIAMSVSASNPPPVEILARDLVGELLATMRTFRYASADDANAAARLAIQSGICTYDAEGSELAGRPEITVTVVSGPIPTTAFAGFRLADRRFTVAVVAASDDEAAIEAARQLAGTIATLELDAARTPAPPG